ncbi:hypothetical protein [Bradyrhizobium sp. LA6.7]|uniref:hypothetical protein n=1 Tax=unclassified Bradyrhizobium TaxID=2631580 RepID=UPI003394B7AC
MPVQPDSPPHIELLAEIGVAAQAAGGIDNSLTIALGALLAPAPSAGLSLELSSVFIFSARSIDQRMDLVNKVFDLRFAHLFALHRNANGRRAAEFLKKLKGLILNSIVVQKWVRNLAAHGNVDLTSDVPRLIPAMFDLEAKQVLAKRGANFANGLSASQLKELSAGLSRSTGHLTHFGHATQTFIQWFGASPDLFLSQVNKLAKDMNVAELHLHDPTEGPPMRQARSSHRP